MLAGDKTIIGMVHVGALPGTPRHRDSIETLARRAVEEAEILRDAGLDALLIENMFDVPYLRGTVGPEVVAAMTAVGQRVRDAAALPLGVQLLAAANREALAVAHAIGAAFVRVENFVFAHVADEGVMPEASAGPLMRYRRQIGADSIRIIADVKKKHGSHAVTADISLAETAEAAAFFGADGVVVTGRATGVPVALDDLVAVRQRVTLPVCVGSGVSTENLDACWPFADAFIVGSCLKVDGIWSNRIDPQRAAQFMRSVRSLRGG